MTLSFLGIANIEVVRSHELIPKTMRQIKLNYAVTNSRARRSLCPYIRFRSSVPEENLEVPITENPLEVDPTQCSATQHTDAKRDDSYEVPMPLESVSHSSTPPPTHPTLMGMRPNPHGFARDLGCHG